MHDQDLFDQPISSKALGPRVVATTVIIVADGRVLLGFKKRGFGAGKWTGFGGKVNCLEETVEEAAARELMEEASIEAVDLECRGVLQFEFAPPLNTAPHSIHVFAATAFRGQPLESDEMRPDWHPTEALPYGLMWPDAEVWMPVFFEGTRFRATFFYDDFDTMPRSNVEKIS
eukprot:TRINITY_DN14433_c0_g1_i1.p1 TRINITY_DN14433_c0_g1~~TRINITY_DN14433_c0_g1_i1.p1  ORF type:complete len:173 (+),score=50.03 TRINITY_DN14433_c0_g1_i1:159-677(+)